MRQAGDAASSGGDRVHADNHGRDPHEIIDRLADGVLPALIARLDASGLGELEIRADGWHVRLRKPYDRRRSVALPEGRRRRTEPGDAGHARRAEPGEASHVAREGTRAREGGHASRGDAGDRDDARAAASDPRPEPPAIATAPAVGYFAPRDGWGPGRHVRSGDVVGYVDCLGVRQDVVAPVDGFLGRLLAQPGEAVEYGQPLLHVDLPAVRPVAAPAQASSGSAAEPGTADTPTASAAPAVDVPDRAVGSAPGARPEGA